MMYVKHPDYKSPAVPVPGKENDAVVYFENHVAEVSDAVGKKLVVEKSAIVQIDKEEYDAAVLGTDMRHDLPQVHSKDGTLPHSPATGEQPNPMSKNDPEGLKLTDGQSPKA